MNVPPDVVEVLQNWVRKAENDLEAARRIMAVEADCPVDAVGFHCQQAVEKYVKGLLTAFNILAPRIHDLEVLAALLPAGCNLSVQSEELAKLSLYAVDIRYDDSQDLQLEDARHAFAIAEKVRAEIRGLLPTASLE